MDVLTQGIIAAITATGIAIAGFVGVSATAEPVPAKSSMVMTVCGSGGLVPPTAENKCSKP
jgi:hypothetical protein